MKKHFRLCLTGLLALGFALLTACGGSTPADTTVPTTPPAEVNKNVKLDLIKDGKTDYTIVYDDKSEAATKLANTVKSAFSKQNVEIAFVAASSAEADYGKEIVVGNLRASAADVTAKLKPSDFAMCVSGDDWVLVATDETNYNYLNLVAKERLSAGLTEGALTVESDNDLICSSSAYADVPYAAYVRRGTRGLSQEQVESFFVAKSFSSDRTRLPYQIYVPSNYDPAKQYPVLLFLHGAGERGNGNDKQMVHVIANLFNQKNTPVTDAIVICPQCPDNNQWVDTPWANGSYSTSAVKQSNEASALLELLDQIAATYSTDPDRYYVMGISMGGFGTWDLLMRAPDRFAAGVPICGGADPAMADTLKNVPIYTTHSIDDPVVPISGTREMVEALQAAGSTVIRYDEVNGKGHEVWKSFSEQTKVLEWLFSQKLSDRK
ncbi:MAG: prolyl oligopeptidase family serine peptidase [Clostridia bacterium]|nr:prolyl oligopeptidase family serine peptidase [Clostridia bacterium]